MNLPNLLTLSRIFLTCILGVTAQWPGGVGAVTTLAVFVLASLTDLLDGFLARKYNLITTFGKIMDPIADKCLILTALFIFSFEGLVPVWMVLLVAGREIAVTASRIFLMTKGQAIPAEKEGKIKTVVQVVTVSMILLYRVCHFCPVTADWVAGHGAILLAGLYVFMVATLVLTLWSGVRYFLNLSSGGH